ncbi:MAG: double-strand break repair protein AddB, partial [Pikeienuella sp.]
MRGLYAIPPGLDVAEGFAHGFWARFGKDHLRVARTEVFVNTPRAARRIEAALADGGQGSALLPRLRLIDELGTDPLLLPDLPPPADPLRRHLTLIRLVEAYLSAREGEAAPAAAAPGLAGALERLVDEIDEEGLAPAALDALGDTAPAGHWQRMHRFIGLIQREWPKIRDAGSGANPDPKARQRRAVAALCARWAARPPEYPVLAVGSTGAVASTARLLAAIARLPVGAVVLPGIDTDLDAALWAEICGGAQGAEADAGSVAQLAAPEHPMAPFARLLGLLGARPADVAPWLTQARGAAPSEGPAAARARLLREAFRPAPVTDAWAAAAPRLAREDLAATAGLTLLTAPHPRLEAAAIAVAIREALETPGRQIALVTAEAALARRVSAVLAGFGVMPDDSFGRPLAGTAPAVFLRLLADVAMAPDPVGLAALLQHPLMRNGLSRLDHLALARSYERAVLREPQGLGAAGPTLPPWPQSPQAEDADPDGADREAWRARIDQALAPLRSAVGRCAPLTTLLAAHIAAAVQLSTGPEDGPQIWHGPAGAALDAHLARLTAAADAHGDASVAAYRALLADLLDGVELRPSPGSPHPRVAILGPREARTAPADLLILGGLVEGVWPSLPDPDPWLSRPMRRRLGLPAPELRIGLAALDLYQVLARPEVLLTRSVRRGGAPAMASRWLVRLESLLGGVAEGRALAAMQGRGRGLRALADRLPAPDRPTAPAPPPPPRAPQPPPPPPQPRAAVGRQGAPPQTHKSPPGRADCPPTPQ